VMPLRQIGVDSRNVGNAGPVSRRAPFVGPRVPSSAMELIVPTVSAASRHITYRRSSRRHPLGPDFDEVRQDGRKVATEEPQIVVGRAFQRLDALLVDGFEA
jgi:hypothetical protein